MIRHRQRGWTGLISQEEKLKNALGFAMKAGKVASGEFSADRALKRNDAKLIVLDNEASDNTKKRWRDACESRGVPIIMIREMGDAIGKDARMVAAVTDKGFSAMVLKSYNENNNADYYGGNY